MKVQPAKYVMPDKGAKSGGLSKTEGKVGVGMNAFSKNAILKTPEKPNVHGKSLNSTSKPKNPDAVRPAPQAAVKLAKGKIPPEPHLVKTVPAKELFAKTAANMGFPKDALSAALIAFARYFSISLNPALLKALRREILASGKSSSPESPPEKTALEADALSALIADDKGVILSPQALEHYARFLSSPGGNRFQPDKGEDHDREECPDAEELRVLVEEQGQNDDTLSFLNNLPGKNGQRWLVFPFSISVRGIEFQVFLRLLKKEPVSSVNGAPLEDGHLIVDISSPKRQWRCFLKKAGEKLSADLRVYPRQPPGALKKLQKEAERILGEGRGFFGSFKGFGEILLQNGEETPSWAEDLYAESLPSIDEEI
jgi:hypothetical protein